MLVEAHLQRTIGPEDQKPRGCRAATQEGQQIERGVITPVQIFEHQEQWRVHRQGLHQGGKLAHHAIPCAPVEFIVQALPVLCSQ
jgi:hypothetical protein